MISLRKLKNNRNSINHYTISRGFSMITAMKKILLIYIIYIFIDMQTAYAFDYVSFDQSMRYNPAIEKTEIYKKLEDIYQSNNPNKLTPTKNPIIPKIIHQIWLGPLEIPEKYKEYTASWKNLHSDWEYKLWREKDIENWNFASKDLYNKASSYQEKSDILRYEILKKFGGLYIDLDYRALKSFDKLHHLYSFYGSIEPPLSHDNNITISNAIIASAPNNPIFEITLHKIRNHWNEVEDGFRNEAQSMNKKGMIIHLAVNRTMMPYNEAVFEVINSEHRTIIFPPTYMSIENRFKLFDFIKRILDKNNVRMYFRSIQKETMAIQDRGKNREIDNLSNIKIHEPWYRIIYKYITSIFN